MLVSSGGMTQGGARQMQSGLGQNRLELEVRAGQCMQAIPPSWILDYGGTGCYFAICQSWLAIPERHVDRQGLPRRRHLMLAFAIPSGFYFLGL